MLADTAVASPPSSTSAEAMKKVVERRVRPKIYGLGSFLHPGCSAVFYGAFRDNIRRFLQECADVEEAATSGMPTWRTLLIEESSRVVLKLYVVEECVRSSAQPFCDYCRCAGWSHHFVSQRRYHVIIPAPEASERLFRPDASTVSNHLLHGILHCNGFGHLLLLNAWTAGTVSLQGHRLMDLWDRFCSTLRAREVSLQDLSSKRSMELRLLYGVAYGFPWFTRWGYRFAKACYGATEVAYNCALDELSFLPLDTLIDDLEESGDAAALRRVIATYRDTSRRRRELDAYQLVTVRDLLRFLLHWKRRSPSLRPFDTDPFLALSQWSQADAREKRSVDKKRKRFREFERVAEQLASRWSVRRLRASAEVIVGALRQHGRKMSRQEVRDAARLSIGDTGLIDFVLKSLGDCEIDGYLVRRSPNPRTRVLEFSLEKVQQQRQSDEEAMVLAIETPDTRTPPVWPSMVQLEKDVQVVYQSLLKGRVEAAGIVLDAKHWVKKWGLQDDLDDRLRFLVMWMPSLEEMDELSRALPPAEVVVVEATASVGELITEAERAMRDTYCVMEGFRAEGVDGVEGEDWEPVLTSGAESGAVLWVYGDGVDMGCGLRHEGGADAWVVACSCGAQDDDGERMVACDVCDVWHHTKCADIPDTEPVPPIFLCNRCGSSLLALAVVRRPGEEGIED